MEVKCFYCGKVIEDKSVEVDGDKAHCKCFLENNLSKELEKLDRQDLLNVLSILVVHPYNKEKAVKYFLNSYQNQEADNGTN